MAELSLEFLYVRELLQSAAGIYLEDDKDYLVKSRIGAIASQEGFAGIKELIQTLKWKEPTSLLHRKIIEAMMTNETFFFREMATFDALHQVVVPELIQKRATTKKLALMSNACSTGQEPYSLAMLLHHNFPELKQWELFILATDYSRGNLNKAREGLYRTGEFNRGVPEIYKKCYFSPDGDQYRIDPAIKNMIEFRELNLKDEWTALPKMDIIFLRNVLIYFTPTIKAEILAKAQRILRPDGFLFLGSSETTIGVSNGFNRVRKGSVDCYQLTSASP